MGKNEFLTPKAIANRIKAKGLQKLRLYCQMCQKQCRNENGFKCHCMSESHQRQMEVFGQNPNRIVDGYSEEFESMFLEHMKRSHRFSRIAATVVCNEYISDRHHIHMNATQWAILIEFVKYLGRTGKCKVDETPKGWFITYIDRDSETLFKEKMKNKRAKADIVDEEKQEREIMRQIERAEQLISGANDPHLLVAGLFSGSTISRLRAAEPFGHCLVFKIPVSKPAVTTVPFGCSSSCHRAAGVLLQQVLLSSISLFSSLAATLTPFD
ncbi:hypothetical protein E3N88_11109 [Mikania micrantha]|uniref:DNA/RNA-binding protein Kin17 WH-like domain-containing protein n=1 Tax=Mikania micrantha TaxID=192012 RepID=A0A5N6PDK9_9ASTR|nr:hypothetical protein E3N88_11109 [Mikania micrantha]